jgi:acyl-CoA synthetase (AMP-forming)/AMP-acid ligase II/thioesterase domain-containing protein
VIPDDDYLQIGQWARRIPEATALASPGRTSLTYAGLWEHVTTTSETLSRCGVQAGEVVALAVSTGPFSITGALAITLRSVCAPLDLHLKLEDYRAFLPRIGASTLVFEAGVDSPIVDAARELGLRVLRLSSAAEQPAGVFTLEALEEPRGKLASRQLDAKFLLHTSATTGAPKLVPRTRLSVLAAAEQDVRALKLGESDRYLSMIPLNIGHGLTMIFSQLLCGGAVFCAPAFEAAGFETWLRDFRPTWFAGGSSISRLILAIARQKPETFARVPLRFVCSLGAAPEADLVPSMERLLGVPVLENYGMTEASGVTRNTLDGRKAGSVGRSTGAEIAIFDEAGKPVPPESEGEVAVRGPTLMAGYLDDPQANGELFRDGWFLTGDIGRIDRDGFLFIAGRKKEMIDRGGKKIAPQEIDSALALHPAIAEVAAFAIPHRTLVEEPAAAVVLEPGQEISALELRRFAAARLAAYKVPRKIVFLERIPRATTGKPKRAALSEQFRDLGAAPDSRQLDPPTGTEEKLLELWRKILGLDRITTGDDFFDLGGDSLSAAHMLTQAGGLFALSQSQLPEADFFDEPTVAALARSIAQRAGGARVEPALENRVLVLERDGARLPIFCFSTGEDDAYQFRHLARWLGPEQPFTVICPANPVERGRLRTIEEIARQAVTSIRALRPLGPYIITGHCYGGVVAFEAAQQLMAEGAQVALLALFDTPTPGYPKIVSAWRNYLRALAGVGRGRKLAGKDIAEHLNALARLALRRTSPRSGPVPAGDGNQDAAEATPPEFWHPMLMARYRPRLFSAPIAHLTGADVPMSTQILSDPRLGWRDFAGGQYELHPVAGDHVSIFSESNAPQLAAVLEQVLAKLDAAVAACDKRNLEETGSLTVAAR